MFRADPAVRAVLGDPPRIWDEPVRHSAFPFAFWRRWETRPVNTSERPTLEHIATLEIISRQTGADEARAAVAALAAVANGPRPPRCEAGIVLVLPVYTDVLRSVDGRTFQGLLRLKVIAEGPG